MPSRTLTAATSPARSPRSATSLREALATSAPFGSNLRDRELEAELRRQVCAFVNELQAAGWPPERVLNSVKQIAWESGLAPSPSFTIEDQALTDRDTLLARIVRWTVDHYFDHLDCY
jgi:hypothetical protein